MKDVIPSERRAQAAARLLVEVEEGSVAPEQVPEATAAAPAWSLTGSEERQRMIAEAAYYRAEQRGFEPGAELEDWLEAEAAVDRALVGAAGPRI